MRKAVLTKGSTILLGQGFHVEPGITLLIGKDHGSGNYAANGKYYNSYKGNQKGSVKFFL
jgi:acetyl-CoA carboxylase carboxyltransferase component